MQPILVEYRRTIWSDTKVHLGFDPGTSLEEIVAKFPNRPEEFETHGGVFLVGRDGRNGCYVDREYWKRVRPKAGTLVYVSLVPHGGSLGGGGGTGKQVFAIVASVALLALTAGTASFLGGLIPAALGGAFTANVIAGGVAIGGGLLLQKVVGSPKPDAGPAASVSGVNNTGPTIGSAGITQNPITAWSQIPCVKGEFVGSPPILAKPYTLIDKTDQVAHVIVGYAGQYDISEIKINDTAVEDFADGVIEYETREGWLDDAELSLITYSVFEENTGQEMSKHRLDTDQQTLIEPASESYPRPQFMKSVTNTDKFRVILAFPSGIGRYSVDTTAQVNFRMRMRRYENGVAGAWVNLPELVFEANVKTPFRQQMWFIWDAEANEEDFLLELLANNEFSTDTDNSYFKDADYTNAEWTADSYFTPGLSGIANHSYAVKDGIYFYLDEAIFPKGQYEFEIKRNYARDGGTSFQSGTFTSNTTVDGKAAILQGQQDYLNVVAIQSYASFRYQYPIRRKGLALIAVKARNIQIQSISAKFKSYVTPAAGMHMIAQASSPDEAISYNFASGGIQGWAVQQFGGAGPATIEVSSIGLIYKDNGAVDSNFHKEVTFLANDVDRVFLDIETVEQGASDRGVLICYVSTGGHMFVEFDLPENGERQVIELDVTSAGNGGGASAGWAGKTLTILRFDNEDGGGGHFIIRSVRAVKLSDGTESILSSNPAHHFFDIMTGELNSKPVPQARVEDLSDWSGHCFNENLTLDRVIESGTTEDALTNSAACGDAILRRSDKYGVVVDKDRSEEECVGLVSPHIMVSPLVTTVNYLTSSRAYLPSFHDATKQYSVTEFESPVYDDGVAQDDNALVEATAYDGLTRRSLVRRRSLRDLRSSRIRNKVYSFSLDAKVLDFKKGDKIGLAHDTLLASWASGRIASFQTSGGNLVSITLNTDAEDVPSNPSENNFFTVGNVLFLSNIFNISQGYGIGAHVELDDGAVVTIPILSVSGKVLTVDGTLATPDGLAAGCLVNLGPTSRESREVIVTNISPGQGLTARIECVDLGAEIYRNLVAA